MPAAEDSHATETLVYEGAEALKALGTKDGKARVGAYAIRFSSPAEKDLTGDYFTPETDFGSRKGDGAFAMFHHGLPIAKGLEHFADRTFGEVNTRCDDVGIFAETTLDLSDQYQRAIAGLCEKGKLRWSSGSAMHVVKKASDGHIKRWPIVEFSFTPTPAEPRLPAIRPMKAVVLPESEATALAASLSAAGVDTSAQQNAKANTITSVTPRPTMPDKTPEQIAEEQRLATDRAVKSRQEEVNEILATATRFRCLEKAQEFIREGKSAQDFSRFVLTEHLKPGKAVALDEGRIGMNKEETERFSVVKAIRDMATHGRLEGLEKEASETAVKKYGRHDLKGLAFIIPDDVLRAPISVAGHHMKSGLIMGNATQGGFLMQPELGPLIELLRSKPRVVEAGATSLTGLVGDMYLPRQTSGMAANWYSETGVIIDSGATFEQVKLTPHRLGCTVPYSLQFIAQTALDAESVIRNDAVIQLSRAKDRAALHGTGANGQPLGLANQPNVVHSVTYGGAPVWGDVIEHETGITSADADLGDMAFMLSAATVGKWKTTPKVGGFPSFLIEPDMTANGYEVLRTNQVEGNISFFGAWAQLYLASWAGLSVIVDPYTLATSGQVRVTFQELCDVTPRQPKAFNVSTDSAAQA